MLPLQVEEDIGELLNEANFKMYNESNYHDAIRDYTYIVSAAQNVGNKEFESAAYGHLGNAFGLAGNDIGALEYHTKHAETARSIGDTTGEAVADEMIALISENLEEYNDALTFHSKALSLWSQLGDVAAKKRAYSGISNTHFQLAKEYSDKATELGRLLDGDSAAPAKHVAVHFDGLAGIVPSTNVTAPLFPASLGGLGDTSDPFSFGFLDSVDTLPLGGFGGGSSWASLSSYNSNNKATW
eukprot:Stramenopile-MAST_4_protein_5991